MASMQELVAALRKLTNRWARLAQDYANESKAPGANVEQAAYQRGYAEGYYKAATELATVLKSELDGVARPRAVDPKGGAAAPVYIVTPMSEALRALQYANVTPRDVIQKSDNSFRAVFSKWENIMPHDRIERVRNADPRLIIITTGNTQENNDPYIDFAFKE